MLEGAATDGDHSFTHRLQKRRGESPCVKSPLEIRGLILPKGKGTAHQTGAPFAGRPGLPQSLNLAPFSTASPTA
jgi:hypothetical protein